MEPDAPDGKAASTVPKEVQELYEQFESLNGDEQQYLLVASLVKMINELHARINQHEQDFHPEPGV